MLLNYVLFLFTLFLVAGLALDTGILEWRQQRLQQAADAAAQEAMCETAPKQELFGGGRAGTSHSERLYQWCERRHYTPPKFNASSKTIRSPVSALPLFLPAPTATSLFPREAITCRPAPIVGVSL
jgi:hypothetical protein